MIFERGFKAWCERRSVELRKALRLRPTDPLVARDLAEHLGIRVYTADDFPQLSETSRSALASDTSGWSAITISNGTKKLIVLNGNHSAGRQSSDLMHELSHHLLEHRPSDVALSKEGLLLLHSYSRTHEAEADWYSACLLLPRPALVLIKNQMPELEQAAQLYCVSLAMLRYRLDVSGVNYQFSR